MKEQVRAVPAVAWVRSSRCNTHNNCVELRLGEDSVRVRDSKNVEAGSLTFDQDGWKAFLTRFVTLR
jgi:hypothetical protein